MQQNWKRNVAIFMSGQALSLFGSSLVSYAISWYIMLTTKSGVFTTISIIANFLPMLLISPLAGVWADRYSRKLLIILADGAIAVCTLILALVFMAGYQELWLLFAASAIRSLGSAVQNPSVNAMLPSIVPAESLTKVNGINSSLQSVITLLSPMLSGALLSLASLEIIFFVDVITASIAIALLLFFLQVPYEKKEVAEEEKPLDTIKQGLRYIGKTPFLKHYFAYFALLSLMFAPAAFLTPLQVARTFGEEVWRLTALEVVFSVGMALGGLLIAAWGGFKNRIHTIAIACILMSVCTLVLGLPISFWPYIAAMGIIGLLMAAFNTPAIVLLQERVNPDYIGRVFSLFTMISGSMMPLGMLVFGPLADIISIEIILIATGVLMLLVSLSLMKDKPLLEAGKPMTNE